MCFGINQANASTLLTVIFLQHIQFFLVFVMTVLTTLAMQQIFPKSTNQNESIYFVETNYTKHLDSIHILIGVFRICTDLAFHCTHEYIQ